MEGDRHIGLLYEAAVVPEVWPAALKALAERLGCVDATLVASEALSARSVFLQVGGGGIDPAAIPLYLDHYYRWDPLLPKVFGLPAGSIVISNEVVSKDEWARNPFFQELLIPHGGGHYAGWVLSNEGGVTVRLSLHQRARPIERRELARWRSVGAHALRAVRLAQRLEADRAHGRRTEAAADHAHLVWFAVDDLGRVVDRSEAAEGLLSASVAVRISPSQCLQLADESSTLRLSQLISPACRGQAGGSMSMATPLSSVEVDVVPVGLAAARALGPARGDYSLVYVKEHRRSTGRAAPNFRSALGCSKAEAEIAALIAEGKSPKEIATIRDASINTVRTQIRSLLQVTGTRRLINLAVILARIQ